MIRIEITPNKEQRRLARQTTIRENIFALKMDKGKAILIKPKTPMSAQEQELKNHER